MTKRAADFQRLHGTAVGEDGAPQLREAFVTWLDRAPPPTATAAAAPLTLAAARARLAREEPALAAYVERRYGQRQTVRAVAAALGVGTRQAHERAWRGVGLLAVWTGLAPERVILSLCPPPRGEPRSGTLQHREL